jgi:hypothetical protein
MQVNLCIAICLYNNVYLHREIIGKTKLSTLNIEKIFSEIV